jgi:hypothetical protein
MPKVLDCPRGLHERGPNWCQPVAAALSYGGWRVRSTTNAGRAAKTRIESLTDALAETPTTYWNRWNSTS